MNQFITSPLADVELTKWLAAEAVALLEGRLVVIVDIFPHEKDHRMPKVVGPRRIAKVNLFDDQRFSVTTDEGLYTSQSPVCFTEGEFALHTHCDAHFPIHRIFKVIVPTRENPDGTDREWRNRFHERWNAAVYLDGAPVPSKRQLPPREGGNINSSVPALEEG